MTTPATYPLESDDIVLEFDQIDYPFLSDDMLGISTGVPPAYPLLSDDLLGIDGVVYVQASINVKVGALEIAKSEWATVGVSSFLESTGPADDPQTGRPTPETYRDVSAIDYLSYIYGSDRSDINCYFLTFFDYGAGFLYRVFDSGIGWHPVPIYYLETDFNYDYEQPILQYQSNSMIYAYYLKNPELGISTYPYDYSNQHPQFGTDDIGNNETFIIEYDANSELG